MKRFFLFLIMAGINYTWLSPLAAQPEFYVFNADHQQGFVIISGVTGCAATEADVKDGSYTLPVNGADSGLLFFLHLYGAAGTEFDVKGTIHDGVLQPGTYINRGKKVIIK